MFESIIVPLDPWRASTRALGPATMIATAAGCPIVLMTAVPGPDGDVHWLDVIGDRLSVPRSRRIVVHGTDAATAILDQQTARAGSLVCMATNAHTGLGEIVLGSVASAVIRGTHQPLVLVGPLAHDPRGLDAILVCLDGSELAEAAARTAGVWAMLLHAQLHLVRASGTDGDEGVDLAVCAEQLRSTLGIHSIWEVLPAERPAAALVDHARSLPASLIAMTTHGSTGALGRLMGSTAMRVVHDAPCPVLVVPR